MPNPKKPGDPSTDAIRNPAPMEHIFWETHLKLRHHQHDVPACTLDKHSSNCAGHGVWLSCIEKRIPDVANPGKFVSVAFCTHVMH